MNKKCYLGIITLLVSDLLIKFFALKGYINFNLFNLIKFNLVKNEGISFGLFSNRLNLIIIITFLIIIFLIFLLKNSSDNFEKIGYVLIISGALSNFLDRFFLGYVVDYIDLKIFICNFADILIFLGMIIISFIIIKKERMYENKDRNK